MASTRRWSILTAAFAVTALGASLAVPGQAQAQPVSSGSASFSGDPGDFVTGGGSFSYATGTDNIDVSSSDGSTVLVSINGANGDSWNLAFDAPGDEILKPGTYDGATRWESNGLGAGLYLFGNGRGCNTLTGTFTVEDAVFGPFGYVQKFDATFEQHCDGAVAAARGEVHIANPPPPPLLELDPGVATTGTAVTVNGDAVIHGAVTCSKPAPVTVTGRVTQVVKKRSIVSGAFSTSVDCTPDAPVPWTAQVPSEVSAPFVHGDVEVQAQAEGLDTDFNGEVFNSTSTVVTLRKGTA